MTENAAMEKELLFYEAYEQFYDMAAHSEAFSAFCADAFGEDFSQDGFSDIAQVNRILDYIPEREEPHILDIGCGNGKMLGYLQKQTGAWIYGFDYSRNAIRTARQRFPEKSDFIRGVIGQVQYPPDKFDMIISMDTLYFAPDMPDFLGQILNWLKKGGVFFAAYQEGEVMPRTENAHTTVCAKALAQRGIPYEVFDITGQTYDMLVKKRQAARRHEADFEKENRREWFDMLMGQTEYADQSRESFSEKMARYIYIVRK